MLMFCKPVSSKKRFLPHREIGEGFTFSLFANANDLRKTEWLSIVGDSSIFLHPDYLKVIERGEYTPLICRYVIVYRQQVPCGIIYYQIADFKANVFEELLNQSHEIGKSKRLSLFEKYVDVKKEGVLLRLFTCGNNLVSGEYGFLFNHSVDKTVQNELVLKVTESIADEEKLKHTISAILIKDFHEPIFSKQILKSEKYSNFFVEPNMVVNVPNNVSSVDEYIALFSKKYRNRAKSIFASFKGVTSEYLDVAEIKQFEPQLYRLYEQIFEKAKFKLIKLPKDYFSSVKQIFKDLFTVKIFLKDKKIIAFASSFLMHDGSLEAHYIGFDYALNNEYNLYQNILYSMIEETILKKRNRLNLGRTASEIKTTVGAKPENLICYIKPQNTISKIIQKPFIEFLQPSEWTPRNPFKDEVILS